jgi:hypothetical protein
MALRIARLPKKSPPSQWAALLLIRPRVGLSGAPTAPNVPFLPASSSSESGPEPERGQALARDALVLGVLTQAADRAEGLGLGRKDLGRQQDGGGRDRQGHRTLTHDATSRFSIEGYAGARESTARVQPLGNQGTKPEVRAT